MLCIEKLQLRLHGKSILEDVSFVLPRGHTLCIVGESGSGKSSLLRAVNGLLPATFGSLSFHPKNGRPVSLKGRWKGVAGLSGSRWVMQDPISALNPKLPLGVSVGESVFAQKLSPLELKSAVSAALADVELSPEMAKRRPAQVSMGQAQRACLARALIARPDLIFFDEPLSALDAIVQKQIAATMKRIQTRFDTTFVIVTHDLGFAAAYADHMLVLRGGRVEANQSAETFFKTPESDYCRELIAAAHELGSLSETVAQVSGTKAATPC
ncbi:MAG: dipeptide/oligopeptide/nickel ABC transporter ATP-binding protein [Roseibium sp.]|uniref:ABC transporter ATP-binding protein n=1 Tax=Roseibium sp. TaxID=1936156 RepID=UPI0026034D4E|nr:dipeptide/oligopeptide/nickel ABC transporter ATP-binding protein [Roseibium sp.]MCV0427896.1 dipeptide/oligopeptide/nickel ABC transporter ATP-binding protein [Roseibium sp.]